MFDSLTKIDPLLVAYCLGGAAAAVLLFWIWLRYRRFLVRRSIRAIVDAVAYEFLADVLIPDGMEGFFHFDFLLLTQRGILVLDLREIPGVIFGGDQMDEWTVMTRRRRYTFANPQGPLLDRIAVIKQLAGETPVEGRIAFTARSRFPKGRPKSVLMLESLRVEYAPVDKGTMAAAVSRYRPGWDRVRENARPSDLARP
jgi:Nuclease-related domain